MIGECNLVFGACNVICESDVIGECDAIGECDVTSECDVMFGE